MSNAYLQNPYMYNQAALDFVESYLPGVPASSWWGYGGATVGYFYGYDKLYSDLKDLSQSKDNK